MPELPEVETVRCALAPVMVKAHFVKVEQRRQNLRYDFPSGFVKRLVGKQVRSVDRRGKYLLIDLSSDETLIVHLGMSGRFTVKDQSQQTPGEFHHIRPLQDTHDHVVFVMGSDAHSTVSIIYNDPRRFGFMDLCATDKLATCRHFAGMGPEPLSNEFSEKGLRQALATRKIAIKQALLDQRVVAGLGNIYVCEALFRAGISPRRPSNRISEKRIAGLYREICLVLKEAIASGGSSLRDFASSDGSLGYFQHAFVIYDREGEACRQCERPIKRIVQAGRSTFYCSTCQR